MMTYLFKCPDCGEVWTAQFDPADPARYGHPPTMDCRNLKRIGAIEIPQRVNGRRVRVKLNGKRPCSQTCRNSTHDYCECSCGGRAHGQNRAWRIES